MRVQSERVSKHRASIEREKQGLAASVHAPDALALRLMEAVERMGGALVGRYDAGAFLDKCMFCDVYCVIFLYIIGC